MLKDKVIIITGGAGLLGSSFAQAIAEQEGVSVVADLDLVAAKRVAAAILEKTKGSAEAMSLDITDKTSINDLLDGAYKKYGRVDAVVNNAYPRNENYGRKLEDVTYKDFCENVSLHLGGYFLLAQQAGLFFKKQGKGNIVNMASIYGTVTPRFEIYEGTSMTMPVEYAAIKSSVIQLTRYFAQHFKTDGIRVNSLSPGGIKNSQPEAFLNKYKAYCGRKGMLDSSDITGALLFLLSDASQYMTGQNIIIDDGFSL